MTWQPATREEIEYWHEKAAFHAAEASKASDKWNARKAALKDYYARHENGRNPYNDEQKRVKEDNDPELKKRMGTWDWHRREQRRWEGRIQAELAMRQLMGVKTLATEEIGS